MAKFHINPKTGNVGRCTAETGANSRGCPYGSPDEHFDSVADARSAYEETMNSGGTFNAETAGFDRIQLGSSSGAKLSRQIGSSARRLMSNLFGDDSSYPGVMLKARENASYVNRREERFQLLALDNYLKGNAQEQVAQAVISRTAAALAAASGRKIETDTLVNHSTPATVDARTRYESAVAARQNTQRSILSKGLLSGKENLAN